MSNIIAVLPKVELDSDGYLTYDGEYSKALLQMGYVRTSVGKWARGTDYEVTEAEIFKIYGGWSLVEPLKELTNQGL